MRPYNKETQARYNQSEKGRARKRRWKNRKYASDPIWRHEGLMNVAAYKRAKNLTRRKEQLASEPTEFLTIL